MKKLFSVLLSVAFLVSVAATPVWAGGGKVRSDKAAGPAGDTGGGTVQTTRGN